jgi:hypothetical protein
MVLVVTGVGLPDQLDLIMSRDRFLATAPWATLAIDKAGELH